MKLIILILQLSLAIAAKYRSLLVAEPASLVVSNQTQVAEGDEVDDVDHLEPIAGDDEDPAPTEDDAQDEGVTDIDMPEEVPDADASLAAESVNLTSESGVTGTLRHVEGLGEVFVKEEGEYEWYLLMKLHRNHFCQDSPRWTDGQAFRPEKMNDANWIGDDAKSLAFHELEGIDAIKLQTNWLGHGDVAFRKAPEVHFKHASTAEKLITTNDVDIIETGAFNSWAYWGKWKGAFHADRNRAPAFMRANRFVQSPAPQCRTDPQHNPSGCGKTCIFCMQAGDGNGCPTHRAHNDISTGIGLSRHFCGGGHGHYCSTNSKWADRHMRTQTLVWGRKRSSKFKVYTMDYGGDVLVRTEEGESWALVMKLSKNDFCHGSSRWTDQQAFNPEKMYDALLPGHQEYDAKSMAFHKMDGVTGIKIQTNRQHFKDAVEIYFQQPGTPEMLITSNTIKMSTKGAFNKKAFWQKWMKQYGNSRQGAPAFMRADKFVLDPAPECRTNPTRPVGCGKNCVFCMQAHDARGLECPRTPRHNDVSVGIGLSAAYCGGGNGADCSSSGNWVGDSSTLVWAKWRCIKHETGQCTGFRHYGMCSELTADNCDTHYVYEQTDAEKDQGAYIQCKTVDGQCVAAGGACFGSCVNGQPKESGF